MNRNLLEYEIKSNNLTVKEFYKKLGISSSAYYRKVSGRSEFTQSEILKTMEILKLKSPTPIFFAK